MKQTRPHLLASLHEQFDVELPHAALSARDNHGYTHGPSVLLLHQARDVRDRSLRRLRALPGRAGHFSGGGRRLS